MNHASCFAELPREEILKSCTINLELILKDPAVFYFLQLVAHLESGTKSGTSECLIGLTLSGPAGIWLQQYQ